MMKATKAASPLAFAVAKASSSRPPIPRSMSATEVTSLDATFNGKDDRCSLMQPPVVWIDLRNAEPVLGWDFFDMAEKAIVDDPKVHAASHAESDVMRILNYCNY